MGTSVTSAEGPPFPPPAYSVGSGPSSDAPQFRPSPEIHHLVDDCVFCDRLCRREYDYSDNHAVAFQPLNPVTPGHFLVVPRIHVSDFMDNPEVAGRTLACAAWIAKAMDLTSANVITSAGTAATQTVFHLHVHVVPRRDGDGLALPWTNQHVEPLPDLEDVHGGPRPMCEVEGCTDSIRPEGTCTRGHVAWWSQ